MKYASRYKPFAGNPSQTFFRQKASTAQSVAANATGIAASNPPRIGAANETMSPNPSPLKSKVESQPLARFVQAEEIASCVIHHGNDDHGMDPFGDIKLAEQEGDEEWQGQCKGVEKIRFAIEQADDQEEQCVNPESDCRDARIRIEEQGPHNLRASTPRRFRARSTSAGAGLRR